MSQADAIEYELDGNKVRPAEFDASARQVKLSTLPAMIFRGIGHLLDQLPVVGLTVAPPTDLVLSPQRRAARFVSVSDLQTPTEIDKSSVINLADTLFTLLKDSIRDRISPDGSTHLGICVSGGLDSCLILSAAAEMKRDCEISDVSAFHYTWPDIVECNGERVCATEMCGLVGVNCYYLDQSKLTLRHMLEFYRNLPIPYSQAFHIQLIEAGNLGKDIGVDTLLTGVGAEVHFAEPSLATAIEQGWLTDNGSGEWQLSNPLSPESTPEWATDFSCQARDRAWNRKICARNVADAMKLARLFDYHEMHSCLAHEHFLYSADANRPSLHYPYMDPKFVVFASSLPSHLKMFRCGAEVYNKGLLRIALREAASIRISLRSSGAPYESIEQNYMRRSWNEVRAFWRKQSQLENLGLINAGKVKDQLRRPRDFLRNSTFNLPITLLESWLRNNPDRVITGE